MPHFIWISYCNATEGPKNSQILPHFQLQNALDVLSNGTKIKMNNGAQLQTFPYTTVWKLFRSSNGLMLMLNSHISPFKSMKDKKQTRNHKQLFSAVTSESTGWLATLPPEWTNGILYHVKFQLVQNILSPMWGKKPPKYNQKCTFFKFSILGAPAPIPLLIMAKVWCKM